MKSAILAAFVLAALNAPWSANGAPHPIANDAVDKAPMQARQRCTIAFWDYWRNPNNCQLIYPGYPGQPPLNPTPRPTSTRSTTTTRSTSTRSTSTSTRTTTTTTRAPTGTTIIVNPTGATTIIGPTTIVGGITIVAPGSTATSTSTTSTTTTPTATVGTPVPSTTTATTTPVSTPVPTGQLTADQQTVLDVSNAYRARHNAPALTWDASLAASAQTVANTCVFQHSNGNYGENLAAGTGNYAYTSAVNNWYDEIADYNFNAPGFSTLTGHFTQLVWASSNLVGCARNTQCTPQQLGFGTGFGTQATFIVCQYRPAGNVIGAFAQNVFPPVN